MRSLKKWNKRIGLICVIVSAVFLTACESEAVSSKIVSENSNIFTYELTKNDIKTSSRKPVEINLSEVEESLVLEEAGEYLVSGELYGSIIIDVEDQNVHLFLSDVNIKSKRGPALVVQSAGKVFITIVEGTENTLSDSPNYDREKEENACIYSLCDLTINGSGKLQVSGLYKDAIHCKDVLKVLCSDLKIRAKRDGLRGSDGVYLKSEDILIEAEGNGIRTINTGKIGKGSIEVAGGNISIISGKYGLNSAGDLRIYNSLCYLNGILGNMMIVGEMRLDEGCLQNESL